MKALRRILSITISCAMILCLAAGCGSNGSASSPAATGSAASAAGNADSTAVTDG